jgi:GalNAc-alpha-(1->4)-GalNAc-alpha-(1->3)-diNAcBac-PP-undecaprenol alpha-1,4-N-acetyl-D-galactosaminyltransferase
VKLLFFIASLQCGGAERVCATLCNHWAEQGWDVTLATFDDGSEPPFFPIDPRVRRQALGIQRRSTSVAHSILNNLRRVPRLRRTILEERPDRVLSFIDGTNVLTLLAASGTGIPVVVSERTNPARHRIPGPWRVLRRLTYPWAHAIVVQTEDAVRFFPPAWRRRIAVVPNPVPAVPAEPGPARPDNGRRRIVALGRLDPPKGFDLLIDAFASVAPLRPEWDLVIFGEGTERAALVSRIERAGLSERARLPGVVARLQEAFAESDLFVLSSRYEGFPNALCEALAFGLPAVAFDCPSGPSEILRNGVDGLLVPPEDVSGLAAAMLDLTGDAGRRRAFAGRAPEITRRFSIDRIAGLWETILRAGAS